MKLTWMVLFVAVCVTLPAEDFKQIAIVQDDRIDESSGMAISRTHPDCLWIHNDSGDEPRLFLVKKSGKTRAVVTIKDAKAHDWEDMCSFEIDGKPYLLIGDFGDNNKVRDENNRPCSLYLVEEPTIPDGEDELKVDYSARVKFTYEDGSRNCECLAVDTVRNEILLLTKQTPQNCGFYTIPLDLTDKKQKHVAKRIANVPVPFATAMDLSPACDHLIFITQADGFSVQRKQEGSWEQALQNWSMLKLPGRIQGETICFDRDGKQLYLNSEKSQQPLWLLRPTFSTTPR